MLKTFLELLLKATLVTVDNGPFLHSWDTEEPCDDPDNEIINFRWEDEGLVYQCSLDEGGIANGKFEADGTFVCQDSEDERTEIRMFNLVQLNVAVTSKELS